jgi:hypothetical protein
MKILKHPLFLGVCTTIFTLVVILPFARLGVDAHHDGIMFAMAVAVRNGYQIQKEVYAQYGPIVPWLQGIELFIFGNNILVIKMFSAISIAFASGCFAYFFAKKFSLKVAFLATLIWLACFPGFDASMMMFAWSSDYLLLIFGIIVVLSTCLYSPNATRNMIIRLAIGFCFGTSIFIRINSGIPVAIAFVVLVLILMKFHQAKFYLIGFVASLILYLGYFAAIGSFHIWYEQTIEWPRKIYIGILGDGGFDGLKGNSVVNGLPAIGVTLVLFLLVKNLDPIKSLTGVRRILYYISIIVSPLLLNWLLGGNGKFGPLEPKLFLWAVVPAAVIFIPIATHELLRSQSDSILQENIIFISIAFCGLIQVYPVVDRRHLWWAALPMLGYLLNKLFLVCTRKSGILFIAIIGTLLVPQTVSLARASLNADRVAINSVPSLKGSLVDRDFFIAFDLQLQAVHDYQKTHGAKPVLNLCMDGYFATVGERFELADPYYVLWSLPKQRWTEEKRKEFVTKTKPLMWLCPPVANFTETAATYGYRVIPSDVCIGDDPKFKNWPLIGQLAVPKEWPTQAVDLRAVDSTRCQVKK